jgi:hypothetical protein
MYENVEVGDLVTIFAESIIRFEKKPVYVSYVTDDHQLGLSTIDGGMVKIPLSDKRLDFRPLPLGMCNCKNETVFLSRIPKRQFKQGLTVQNLIVQSLTERSPSREVVNEIFNIKGSPITDCADGRYPSVMEAIGIIRDTGRKALAFHRSFAISADHEIIHITKKVGMYDEVSNRFLFKRSMNYLMGVFENA